MQTISVHSSDAETNLQNIAAVLQEHAVPKYFDEIRYVAEGENKGVQCLINGAIKILIDIVSTIIHYYFSTWEEESGFLHVSSGSGNLSSRFTLIDIFENSIVIHANGVTSTTTHQDNRARSVFIAKSTNENTCVIFNHLARDRILTDIGNSSSSGSNSGLVPFNLGTTYQSLYYAWNSSEVQATNLMNFMCADGSVVKNIYWANIRSGSTDNGVHPVLINGEQYYGLLYNQIIIKS